MRGIGHQAGFASELQLAGRRRIDPLVRSADGRRNYDKIVGKDPGRHYVLTNPNDSETGTDSYLAAGYEVETVRPGGPQSPESRNATSGAKVNRGGQILVSIPIETWNDRVEEGQEMATMLERKILKDGGVEDGLRGRGFEIAVGRPFQPTEET